MIWKILEIEKTKDENVIRDAYRKKLRFVNPEDDEEGFKELRQAYEKALEYANTPEETPRQEEEMHRGAGKKDEVDYWLDKVEAIYVDVAKRRDEECWKEVLHDPACDDLDTELEAAEKLLVFFMSHSYMPQAIWKLVEERFHYVDNYDQLKERFPENYLDYIMWQIKRPNFIDFNLFEGDTTSHVDDYIGTLYEEKNAFEEGDMEKVKRLLKELSRFDVTHPFTQVEEARYLLQCKKPQEALSIMEELDFQYSENPYVERIYGETLLANDKTDKAKEVYDNLLETDPGNFSAALGSARCVMAAGNPEEAKEMVEDILEDRVQDVESMELLDEINVRLVKTYEASLEQEKDREVIFKLGWCYYQQKEFEKGIALMDELEEGKDYDYTNLRCRLYLANEDYKKAYPLAQHWLTLIEETEDDGSKEMTKRKNRLSLAHFSVGVCLWELTYNRKNELGKSMKPEDAQQIEKDSLAAVDYIKKAIGEENNTLVKLSYMEQLGRFYLVQEKYEECIDICNRIIQEDRGFYPAYVHRQKANYELKNAKEVIDDFFICKDLYPGYSVPYVLAAEVFMAFEQYDDVESVIQAGEEAGLESDGLELYKIKCIHYKEFSSENVRKAIDLLDRLMKKIDNRPEQEGTDLEDESELYREMAILYWDLDMTRKALEITEEYLEGKPDSTGMLQLKVDILTREKRYEEALETCHQLVNTEPKNLQYRVKLGNCYERMENTDKALECYRMILMENSRYAPAVRRMMYIYSYLSNEESDLDKCRKGVEYATKLIELTGNAEGYIERGNLYIDLYELEKAVADCKEAIRLDPDAYYAYNNLGCALLKLRRVEEAVEPLEKVIGMEPDRDHLPYLNLAECYVILKQYDKAIEAYKEVLRIRPKAMNMWDEIALIWEKMGKGTEAVDYYTRKIKEYQKKIGMLRDTVVPKVFVKLDVRQDDRERLLRYYVKLAEAYWRMNMLAEAEKWFKNVERVYYKFSEPCNITYIESVIEFYRDTGNIKEAEKVMNRMFDFMKKNKMSRYHFYFTMATVLFEKGEKEKTEKCADLYLESFLKQHGGEENLLADRRYRLMYLYDLAIMNICAGRLEKAKNYLEQISKNHLCVTCETSGCFEYHFGLGLIAELEGRKEEAKKHYQKAIEIKGNYPCCKKHLEML